MKAGSAILAALPAQRAIETSKPISPRHIPRDLTLIEDSPNRSQEARKLPREDWQLPAIK